MTNRPQQRGIVLIAVLSMLTVVISLSAAYVLSVSRDSESLDMLNARIQARYSAYSGIEYGLYAIQDGDKALRWKTEGQMHTVALAGGQVYVTIAPASAKVDINTAQPDLLVILLRYAGLDEETAEQVKDNIVQWRSGSTDAIGNSVSDSDYEAAGLPLPAHRRFYSIEELVRVYGISGAVYQKIKPLITVYGSRRINVWAASDTMLQVLELDEGQIESIRMAIDDYYANETPIPADIMAISPYLDFSRHGSYYRLQAYAETAEGQSEVVYAIIKTRRNRNGSFMIMQRGIVSGKARQAFVRAVAQAKLQEE